MRAYSAIVVNYGSAVDYYVFAQASIGTDYGSSKDDRTNVY
jgi:hypothetical protein